MTASTKILFIDDDARSVCGFVLEKPQSRTEMFIVP